MEEEKEAPPPQDLTLGRVRDALIRQEDSIVFALIERARFPYNAPAYDPSLLPQHGGRSLVEALAREVEVLQAKVPSLLSFFLPPTHLPICCRIAMHTGILCVLANESDRDALMKLLTFEAVEEMVKRRVLKKAMVFGQTVTLEDKAFDDETKYKVDPEVVARLYDEWVIPLTKDVELAQMGSPQLRLLLLLLLLLSVAVAFVSATDHIVGGHLGWNPNVSYTLWANNQTFYVNDLICKPFVDPHPPPARFHPHPDLLMAAAFRYQKNMYNVFEVNKTGYDNCTMDGLAGNWSSGKDFITLDQAKTYYFICGNGFCFSGMKVSVTVHPLNASSAAPPNASTHGAAGSAAPGLRPWPSSNAAALLVAAAASIVIGSGVGI
ncbi:hypothetical protein B296_00043241 [Ensete ventricosum]|uniref:chorismate mutase n=1 Tax=Ensete ventricosum TaxID=4639 RepID=A0A426XNW9_ENSVE|nr:hypothetical protein B296_00043241 [Ensete ventricosum]